MINAERLGKLFQQSYFIQSPFANVQSVTYISIDTVEMAAYAINRQPLSPTVFE